VNEGHPVPELNFADESNRADPHPAQANVPSAYTLFRGDENGNSVAALRSTRYDIESAPPSRFCHSSSETEAQSSADAIRGTTPAALVTPTAAIEATNARRPERGTSLLVFVTASGGEEVLPG